MIVLLLSMVGLAAEPESLPADDAVATRVTAIVAARHMDSCDGVFAAGDSGDVRDALVQITEHQAPPWAPMRAASCLAELAPSDAVALTQTRRLIALPDQPGFTLAVAEKLDRMPAELATDLGRAIWQRSAAEPRLVRRVQPLLRSSQHAAVRAVLD